MEELTRFAGKSAKMREFECIPGEVAPLLARESWFAWTTCPMVISPRQGILPFNELAADIIPPGAKNLQMSSPGWNV